eukprot:snap_masked-scaffold_39-processed-gene-0.7-mRNA-1 protein AED:1.00 eAED:1.00 QI:0/0/0/0/1/1/2/0/93
MRSFFKPLGELGENDRWASDPPRFKGEYTGVGLFGGKRNWVATKLQDISEFFINNGAGAFGGIRFAEIYGLNCITPLSRIWSVISVNFPSVFL